MTIHIESLGSENGMQIKLAGELTIYTVMETKTALSEAMEGVDRIEIDLSDITEIDTAGLQLMLILKSHAEKDVRFVNHPPAVRQLIELANLGAALGGSASIPTLETEDVRDEQ